MNYYEEIEQLIKKNEVNKRTRQLEEIYDNVTTYWTIGKLIVEAQGGEKRAKYGNELIKEWSIKLTQKYGKGYDITNLKRFRSFYLTFSKGAPLGHLSWTNIKIILPIKDENKRNYYINLCKTKNLSKRELEKEIKNNSYERLINKPEKIEIINNTSKLTIKDNMKNPILINVLKDTTINNEQDLELTLLSQLKYFFSQLGDGYALIGNQYKIKNYYIDILLFNCNLNCYVVVELKLRKLKIEDKSQIEKYMKLVDDNLRKPFHNKTMGIIISKEQDSFVANFFNSNEEVILLNYELVNN